MPGMGGPPPTDPKAVADAKFVSCGTCKQLARYAEGMVKQLSKRSVPLDEGELLKEVASLCSTSGPVPPEGTSWIQTYDLVEKMDKKTGKRSIALKRMPQSGVCNSDCKTIEHACNQILAEADTDLSGYMFKALKSKKFDGIKKDLAGKMCEDADDAWAGEVDGMCSNGGPAEVSEARMADKEEFTPVSKPAAAQENEPSADEPKPKKKKKSKKKKKKKKKSKKEL
jgi:hypothetical protein